MPKPQMMPKAKAKNFNQTLKKLFKYLRPYYFRIGFVLIISIIGTVLNVIGPKVSGEATTLLFNGITSKYQGGAGIDFVAIGKILVFMMIIYTVSAFIRYLTNLLISKVSITISYNLRKEIAEKVVKSGYEGDGYTTEAKTISLYDLDENILYYLEFDT